MKKIVWFCGILCLFTLIIASASAADQPQQPPQQPPQDCTDYAKAAAYLGVTEDALKAAIHPGPDYAVAAAILGVSEDALKAAMGESGDGKMDMAAAAATLGVSEDALTAALGFKKPAGQPGDGFKSVAEKLGVTEEAFKTAMDELGQGQKPDDATLAAKLGVTVDALQAAMGDRGGRPEFSDAAKTLNVTEEVFTAALDGAKTC